MAEQRFRVAAGIVSAGLALGVAEVVAVFTGSETTPMQVLGSMAVDHTPDGVREWAIRTFGTSDKSVLYVCAGVVAVLSAAVAGAIERTSRPAGSILLAIFGAVTSVIALGRYGVSGALPTLLGVAAGVYVLRLLTRRIDAAVAASTGAPGPDSSASQVTSARPDATPAPDAPARPQRREVLRGLALTGGLAVLTGVGGSLVGARRADVSGERAAVRLPAPGGPPVALAPEADLRIPGLTPYLTPSEDFYRIDTALIVPQVSIEDWSLRIHGMVDREIVLRWEDLAARQAVEKLMTLTCVSNPVGGDLIGNALWRGYRLDELLAEAGPHADADMVLSTSKDGWTAGSPLAALTDGRDALLAIGMNGEPLPVSHGYPARLVVPGLYGYVSATKWVTEMEVTRFDRATAYWTRRGWSAQGPIKTGTRIDTPRARGRVSSGKTAVAGVAWAQHVGIAAVEVQVDDGPWQQARLSAEQSVDTWRQWVYEWNATPGAHTIRARATDGAGRVQTSAYRDVVPDGATGYPSVTVQVA
ncbi:molybdopterin-dependent oxidoreductase [Nocardia arizonensis]|uniref:molybdopterin-dependent oxidoreductase n=1 Tax=Nocardia arizonensis TaxID=1141647 RepID=UPI0006D009BB|nr:molybdopterin-dependent oxidoreductase [Nocardia arizonensis]